MRSQVTPCKSIVADVIIVELLLIDPVRRELAHAAILAVGLDYEVGSDAGREPQGQLERRSRFQH
eukprot:7113377-Pyramimonas_sp.AAC.1